MVDNICAPATPYGSSAIAIIRCSGPDALNLISKIFKGKDLSKVKSHTINYGRIFDGDEIIDEVVCNVFLAPKSFDGENTVEINCHGGVLVVNRILEALLKIGFRLAEPGEFSKRAFLNKRLDLTQAEAIMDIISAQNEIALKVSQNSLQKATTNLIKSFREKILNILAQVEVNIDYPEYEDSIEVTHDYLLPAIKDLINGMQEIIKNCGNFDPRVMLKIFLDGITISQRGLINSPNGCEASTQIMQCLRDCWNDVTIYNQSVISSLEKLLRDIVKVNKTHGNVLKCVIM